MQPRLKLASWLMAGLFPLASLVSCGEPAEVQEPQKIEQTMPGSPSQQEELTTTGVRRENYERFYDIYNEYNIEKTIKKMRQDSENKLRRTIGVSMPFLDSDISAYGTLLLGGVEAFDVLYIAETAMLLNNTRAANKIYKKHPGWLSTEPVVLGQIDYILGLLEDEERYTNKKEKLAETWESQLDAVSDLEDLAEDMQEIKLRGGVKPLYGVSKLLEAYTELEEKYLYRIIKDYQDSAENKPENTEQPIIEKEWTTVISDGFEDVENEHYPEDNGWEVISNCNVSGKKPTPILSPYFFGRVTEEKANKGEKSFMVDSYYYQSGCSINGIKIPEYYELMYKAAINVPASSGSSFRSSSVGLLYLVDDEIYSYASLIEFCDGGIKYKNGVIGAYSPDKWYEVKVYLNHKTKKSDVYLNDELVLENSDFTPGPYNLFFVALKGNEEISFFDDIEVLGRN